ncbi:MAG: RNA polymerase sigma-70 factor [Prevotellaceae bacterium]|jgi:RNA polymerase sigma-70 factor (ECF subfamily)|nr:RNA polymerase sigma-70 factor [Prevotellaceae bacterium]
MQQQEFEVTFRKYFPLLCAYARRIVPPEDAEEIAEDVLLWVWQHPELQEQIKVSMNSYLFSAVYHRAISRYRQLHTKERISVHFGEELQLIEDVDYYQMDELTRHIETAIDSLPQTYKQAFCMNRFDDMSYKEIADALEVSPKTIDYRICQALKLLRKALKEFL